jgi:signal transduction histidine kinase
VGVLHFEIDTSLLFQLGEQLVARQSIALSELIKNSYDADATETTVLLENVRSPHGTIIIQDNGVGMTFEEIQQNWMLVGTQEKVSQPFSRKYGRPRTGAKGVGRFAVRKLGERLTVHSVARTDSGSKEQTTIDFDWATEFAPGRILNKIPVRYERKAVSANTPTGLILYIRDAREVWDEKDISELQRDLLTLTNPFGEVLTTTSQGKGRTDPGFRFNLEVPEFPEYQGELVDQFLAASWAVLKGQVDSNGVAQYSLSITRPKQKLKYSSSAEEVKSLTGAHFRIYYFVYKKEYLEGIFATSVAQRMGRERGGVRIYLDGFRVFPYGDPSDDWLKLNEIRARRTPYNLQPPEDLRELSRSSNDRPELLTPGNNQLFGAVEISRLQNPGIEVNVSRERFIENESFEALRRFVLIGIYWMTIQYARVTYAEREKRREKRTTETPTTRLLEEARELLEEVKANSVKAQSAAIRTLEEKLYFAVQQSSREREEQISELSLLRVLASAGTAVIVMQHQLREVVDGVRSIYNDLKDLEDQIKPDARQSFVRLLGQANTWREQVENQVGLLSILLSADARQRRKRHPLLDLVTKIEGAFSTYMRDYRVSFKTNIAPNVRTPLMFEAELGALFFNTISNSLKAVKTTRRKEVCIKGFTKAQEFIIQILDSGIGVESEQREVVFEPFVTTSEPDPILGAGTGIGLKVVRDIVESYNGSVRFVDPPSTWSACLEIRLPA